MSESNLRRRGYTCRILLLSRTLHANGFDRSFIKRVVVAVVVVVTRQWSKTEKFHVAPLYSNSLVFVSARMKVKNSVLYYPFTVIPILFMSANFISTS